MPSSLPKLPPGADIVFRRLFDEEDGCHLLISLLNAVLRYEPGARIRKLTLVRTQIAGPLAEDKEGVLDVRAEGEDGRIFHLEVQVCVQTYFLKRILYYWAAIYAGQLGSGQGFSDLRPVISLSFVYFPLFKAPEHGAYHHVFRARSDDDNAVLTPDFEMHTIEMTKFPDDRLGEAGEKWVYWLKHAEEMTQEDVMKLGVPEITEAEQKLQRISQDRALRADYQRRWMAQLDANSLVRDSRKAGRDEGLDEGKRLGIIEGKRETLRDMCDLLGLVLSPEQQAAMDVMDLAQLEDLRLHLKQHRAWPAPK